MEQDKSFLKSRYTAALIFLVPIIFVALCISLFYVGPFAIKDQRVYIYTTVLLVLGFSIFFELEQIWSELRPAWTWRTWVVLMMDVALLILGSIFLRAYLAT